MSQNLQPLSQFVSLDDLPEVFSFIVSPISSVLDNIRIRSIQNQGYPAFNRSGHLAVLRVEQKLGFELPGLGMSLVLNPSFDPAGGVDHTDFFVSILVDHKKRGLWVDLEISNFSAAPREVYDRLVDYFDVSESESIKRAIILSDQNANEFIQSINAQYQSTLVADVDLSLNFDTQTELVLNKINSSAELLAIQKFPFDVSYDLYIDSVEIIERPLRLNEFFSQELNGNSALDFIVDGLLPEFYASIELTAGIEFSRNLLLPVKPNGEVESDLEIKSTLIFDPGNLYFSSNGGFGFNDNLSVGFPPSHPSAQIGKTGLGIGFTQAFLDLSDSTNIPEAAAAGYGPEFKGVFIQHASITLPAKWFNSIDNTTLQIAGYNLLIGTGGISGTIGIETVNGTPSSEDDYLDMKIGNWEVGFNRFAMTFKQGAIVDSLITGRLVIPKLKDGQDGEAVVYLSGHLNEAGDFNLTGSKPDGFTFHVFDFVTINVLTVELGREDENFYIGTSAEIWFDNPIMEKLLGNEKITVPKLRIYDDGRMEIVGGTTVIPTNIILNLGPVEVSVTGIHFGSHQQEHDGHTRKYNYWGFDGAISLDPLGLDARGEGVKYISESSETKRSGHQPGLISRR